MKLRNPEALRAFVGTGRGKSMNGAELARTVGVHRSTVDQLLNDRMRSCSRSLAERIEQALNVPSGVIFLADSGSTAITRTDHRNNRPEPDAGLTSRNPAPTATNRPRSTDDHRKPAEAHDSGGSIRPAGAHHRV